MLPLPPVRRNRPLPPPSPKTSFWPMTEMNFLLRAQVLRPTSRSAAMPSPPPLLITQRRRRSWPAARLGSRRGRLIPWPISSRVPGPPSPYVPRELRSLLQCSPHHLLRRPVEAKLAWVDKIQLGREYKLGRRAPPALRAYYHRRFITGGFLARLRRSSAPPPLRTTDRAPRKALLAITRDEV